MRVLGFQRQPRPPFPFDGAWLTGGGLTLHLIDDDPTIPHALGSWQACWLYVVPTCRGCLACAAPKPWHLSLEC